jgi:hypothetical protein
MSTPKLVLDKKAIDVTIPLTVIFELKEGDSNTLMERHVVDSVYNLPTDYTDGEGRTKDELIVLNSVVFEHNVANLSSRINGIIKKTESLEKEIEVLSAEYTRLQLFKDKIQELKG